MCYFVFEDQTRQNKEQPAEINQQEDDHTVERSKDMNGVNIILFYSTLFYLIYLFIIF